MSRAHLPLPPSAAATDAGTIITSRTPSCIRSKSWLPSWTRQSRRTSSVTWECKCPHERQAGKVRQEGRSRAGDSRCCANFRDVGSARLTRYKGPVLESGFGSPPAAQTPITPQRRQLLEAVFVFFQKLLCTVDTLCTSASTTFPRHTHSTLFTSDRCWDGSTSLHSDMPTIWFPRCRDTRCSSLGVAVCGLTFIGVDLYGVVPWV